jgi:CRISPR-associated protein Csd1
MILQALYEYYQRKSQDPESGIAPPGLEVKELRFIIEIDEYGFFINLLDVREKDEKGKLRGKKYLLPLSKGRSGKNAWQTANLLWDHYGYVLGYPKEDTEESVEMAKKQNTEFVALLKALPFDLKDDAGIHAILSFYEKGESEKVLLHTSWPDCAGIPGCNMSFKLLDDITIIPERNRIKEYCSSETVPTEEEREKGYCLITGEKGIIKQLHAQTPIRGSKSNAKIVAFQKKSGFDSYGKEQAFNAPIISSSEFAYTTALKTLLNSKPNYTFMADATILFWTQRKEDSAVKENEYETAFLSMLSDPPKDNPDAGIIAAKSLFESVYTGKLTTYSEEKFYVLALSPNAARISVRFWKNGSLKELAERFKAFFDDFSIIHSAKDIDTLTLSQILKATAFEYKSENILPNLAASVMSSVLNGLPYPSTLMQQTIRRIRAERDVNRKRAAILKAYFSRLARSNTRKEIKEVTMALDRENRNIAYLLGRLFAVLEKIQEEANPGTNTTIRDRFYGAMSSTPATVFPMLMRLKNHHLSKLENQGRKINFEREIGQIVEGLSVEEMPSNLSLEKQGYFAIGYYHQRQSFFTKKEVNVSTGNTESIENNG